MGETVHRVGVEDEELVKQGVQHQILAAKMRGLRREEAENEDDDKRPQENVRIDVQETLESRYLPDIPERNPLQRTLDGTLLDSTFLIFSQFCCCFSSLAARFTQMP